MSCRSWVRIPALNGHFSQIFVVKIVIFVLKEEIKGKRGRDWPIFNLPVTVPSSNLKRIH